MKMKITKAESEEANRKLGEEIVEETVELVVPRHVAFQLLHSIVDDLGMADCLEAMDETVDDFGEHDENVQRSLAKIAWRAMLLHQRIEWLLYIADENDDWATSVYREEESDFQIPIDRKFAPLYRAELRKFHAAMMLINQQYSADVTLSGESRGA